MPENGAISTLSSRKRVSLRANAKRCSIGRPIRAANRVRFRRYSTIYIVVAAFVCTTAPGSAADAVFERVRAHGVVHCAGAVRPGLAVPSGDHGHWSGLAVDVCRAVAAAVLGRADSITFRPFGAPSKAFADADDIVFAGAAQLVGKAADASAGLILGPTVVHDALALLVPAAGVTRAAELVNKTVCVEPGSPADRALIAYFERRNMKLHEFPFQETDEMRQAFGDGRCDALAGPLTTLASVRADPTDGVAADRILPDLLADDPIFAATPNDERWSRIVWWTFSVLVDAEACGYTSASLASDTTVEGVPPSVGQGLRLSARWQYAALSAGGSYGELFERNLGSASILRLPRGANALWSEGGLIFGLDVR